MTHVAVAPRRVLVVCFLTAVVIACAPPPPPPSCAELTAWEADGIRITTSEEVAAGGQEPAHCKVTGVIDTEINFELLLPLPEDWNGKFMMGGGGGFVGSVQNSAQGGYSRGGSALARGYATSGTDTGHSASGIEAGWALDNPEREENFGHRAVHVTADTSKAIARDYYADDIRFSYFVGCSRGGGQAMIAAQRYPGDFDGIVSGAPALDWPGIGAGFLFTQQAIYPDAEDLSTPVITPELRALLAEKQIAACDGLDGVQDGVLDDPRACPFSPDQLPRCPVDGAAAGCVTSEQLAALAAIYGGPVIDGIATALGELRR